MLPDSPLGTHYTPPLKYMGLQVELAISHNTVCHTLRDPKAQTTIQRALARKLESLYEYSELPLIVGSGIGWTEKS